jgi:hypothetical protein
MSDAEARSPRGTNFDGILPPDEHDWILVPVAPSTSAKRILEPTAETDLAARVSER